MREAERIADQLRRSHEGHAWHGPSLTEVLDGVDDELATYRPPAEIHCIWEIVLHLTTWAVEARETLGGKPYVSLTGEAEWPAPQSAWPEAVERLHRAQRDLVDAVNNLPDERLEDVISPEKGYTVYILLHGIAQHNLYHAGQIALIRKLGLAR